MNVCILSSFGKSHTKKHIEKLQEVLPRLRPLGANSFLSIDKTNEHLNSKIKINLSFVS